MGGSFTTAGGTNAPDIAKWNGSAWSSLGSGLNSYVNDLAVSGSEAFRRCCSRKIALQKKSAGCCGETEMVAVSGAAPDPAGL